MSFDFEKVYENAFLSIEVDNQLKLTQVVWFQHPDSDTFRQGFARAAEVTLVHNCRFWLSDSRAMHYVEFAEQNWILDRMAPLLGNSCLNKFARVNTLESMALLDIDRILGGLELSPYVKKDLEVALFTDRQSALNWLFPQAALVPNPLMEMRPGLLKSSMDMVH